MDFQEAVFSLNQSQHFPREATLERMESALEILGHPERGLKFIHLAGTKGKGSTGALIKSGLEQLGFKVGRFVSPHLVDLTERLSIGTTNISHADFASIYSKLYALSRLTELGLSYFEQLTLVALLYFKTNKPDYIIWETGLGGRLDATNIVDPEIVVITSIGLDHVRLLGNDLVSIAKEKAGTLKKNKKAVIAPLTADIEAVFVEEAKKRGAQVVFAREYLPVEMELNGLEPSRVTLPKLGFQGVLPLLGRHQGVNALTALLTIKHLGLEISSDSLTKTSWPGRLQYFPKINLLVDGAHNQEAIAKFVEFFKEVNLGSKLIFACMDDKDYIAMINLLDGLFEKVYLPKIANKRSIEPEKLAAVFQETPYQVCQDLEEALSCALDSSKLTALVGSFYLVGECLEILEHRLDIKDLL